MQAVQPTQAAQGRTTFDERPDSGFVSVSELAEVYAVSVDTVWRWARQKRIPAPVKLGPNTTRWSVGAIRQALSQAA